MDAELKAKWLTALRSGEYMQGSGRLCRGNQYCCIGVLAHISGCLVETSKGRFGTFQDGYMCEHMPHGDWIRSIGGERGFFEILAEMNDSGKTFAEIADHIETNL